MAKRFREASVFLLFSSFPALGADSAMNRTWLVIGPCVFVSRRETAYDIDFLA
jgi:hypothetical protein